MTVGGWCVVVGLAIVAAPAAHAKSADPTQRKAAQARRACLQGDYQTGMSILTELFVDTKGPNWLYNQGRCLEQNARYEEAILRFEEYLRITKGSDAKDRSEAVEHITDCQAKLAKSAPLTPAPAPAPPPAAPVAQDPVPPVPLPAPVSTVEESQPVSGAQGRGLRIAGITAGAVGVASLAAAVILNVKANSMAKDLNKPTGYDQDKASERSDYETYSWVGYGVGSAFLVGGAILYYFGHRGGRSAAISWIPTAAPGQAGVNLHGAF